MYTASLPDNVSVGRPVFTGGTPDLQPSAHAQRWKQNTPYTYWIWCSHGGDYLLGRDAVVLYGVTTQKIALLTLFNLIYNILCLPGWRVVAKPRLREIDVSYIHAPARWESSSSDIPRIQDNRYLTTRIHRRRLISTDGNMLQILSLSVELPSPESSRSKVLLTESHFSQLITINVWLNAEWVFLFMRSQVQISSRKPDIMTKVLRGSFSPSS